MVCIICLAILECIYDGLTTAYAQSLEFTIVYIAIRHEGTACTNRQLSCAYRPFQIVSVKLKYMIISIAEVLLGFEHANSMPVPINIIAGVNPGT